MDVNLITAVSAAAGAVLSGVATTIAIIVAYKVHQNGFVAQVEKSRYDPYPRRSYPRRSYATAGTATVVGHPSCVNRLSKATRTCNSVT